MLLRFYFVNQFLLKIVRRNLLNLTLYVLFFPPSIEDQIDIFRRIFFHVFLQITIFEFLIRIFEKPRVNQYPLTFQRLVKNIKHFFRLQIIIVFCRVLRNFMNLWILDVLFNPISWKINRCHPTKFKTCDYSRYWLIHCIYWDANVTYRSRQWSEFSWSWWFK